MSFIYKALSILVAMVLHEWAHGFVSYKLGDPTPKNDGRLSLNPIKHVDPIGALCMLFAGFGWAKPVQVNYQYYKDEKKGMAITALAGPLMNFLIAIVAIALNKHIFGNGFDFLFYLSVINISLGVFNLMPLPPLDGSKVVAMLLPYDIYVKYMRIEQYGMIVLFLLVGAFSTILGSINSIIFQFLYTIL